MRATFFIRNCWRTSTHLWFAKISPLCRHHLGQVELLVKETPAARRADF
jgi:hypothetical protein